MLPNIPIHISINIIQELCVGYYFCKKRIRNRSGWEVLKCKGAWGGDGVGQITAKGTKRGVLWGQLQAVARKTLTCQGGVGKRQEGALGRN